MTCLEVQASLPKTPKRRCTGCRIMYDKQSLTRVVLAPNGIFFVDRTGKASGRGAYVCKSAACIANSLKSKGLERSFKRAVPQEIYENLKIEN